MIRPLKFTPTTFNPPANEYMTAVRIYRFRELNNFLIDQLVSGECEFSINPKDVEEYGNWYRDNQPLITGTKGSREV